MRHSASRMTTNAITAIDTCLVFINASFLVIRVGLVVLAAAAARAYVPTVVHIKFFERLFVFKKTVFLVLVFSDYLFLLFVKKLVVLFVQKPSHSSHPYSR